MVKLVARKPDLLMLLEPERDAFDRLMNDISLGIRSPDHFDDCEARMQAIMRRSIAAFRGERPTRQP